MARRRLGIVGSSDEPPAKVGRTILAGLPIPKRKTVQCTPLACGQGDMGQLGLGEDEMERKRPAVIGNFKNIVDICAGGMHSLLLTEDGKLFSFGCNDEGALGRDSSEDGSEFLPCEVDLPGKGVRISAGDSHSACLLEDGRVFAWGSFRDSHGSMGLTLDGGKRFPVEILPGISSCNIASGADHLAILTCDGKVYTVGCGEQGQLGRVSLRTASGESRRGKTQLLKPDLVYIKKCRFADEIWASTYCTFVRDMKTKKIFGFGLNNYNQLALKKIGAPMIAPTATLLEDVKTISGGQHHTLVLDSSSACSVIGRKDYGRLGLGEMEKDIEELTVVNSLKDKNIVDVSCGECQSFAITADGQVYAWGMGSNLQLGTGEEDDQWEPVQIVSKQTKNAIILQVSSGGQHTLFLAKEKLDNSTLVAEPKTSKRKPVEDQDTNIEETETKKSEDDQPTSSNQPVVDASPKVNGLKREADSSVAANPTKKVATSKRGRKKT